MLPITTKNIPHFLEKSDHYLQTILKKAGELQVLQAKVSGYLKSTLRPFCQVANQYADDRGARLVIIAATGTIATALRFEQDHLLARFAQDPLLRHIRHLDIKVRPSVPPRPPAALSPSTTAPMAPLSADNAAILANMAASLADSKLKVVMQSIARRTCR